jgi:hypothetical protein
MFLQKAWGIHNAYEHGTLVVDVFESTLVHCLEHPIGRSPSQGSISSTVGTLTQQNLDCIAL